MEPTEETLVQRCQKDPAAFEMLFRRCFQPIFLFARTMLGNDEDAEEAAQDVLMKILKAADTFKEGFRFAPWMYSIASNHCKNVLRRRHSQSKHLAEVEPDDDIVPSDPETPLEIYASADFREHVDRAVESLGDRYREVFHLRYMAGMSYKEIAEALSLSLSAVETRILRGKAILRQKFVRLGLSPR